MGSGFKNKLHKVFAIALSVCMVCALNPTSALAKGTRDSASQRMSDTPYDEMVYEESGAGVSKTPKPSEFSSTDNTAHAYTNIHVKIIDSIKLENISDPYKTSGTLSEVKGATLKAELTGAGANQTFWYEWVRTSRVVGTDADFESPEIVEAGTLETSFEGKNIRSHDVEGDFKSSASEYNEKEFRYVLNVYTQGTKPISGQAADHTCTFAPIAITSDYVRYPFTGPDKSKGPVFAEVLALRTPEGHVDIASDSVYNALLDKAKKEDMSLAYDSAYVLRVDTDNPNKDKPAYKTVYSLKITLPEDIAKNILDNKGEVKIIGTFSPSGDAFDSGSLDIYKDKDGTYYVCVEDSSVLKSLGVFAVAYKYSTLEPTPTPKTYKVTLVLNDASKGTADINGKALGSNTYEFEEGATVKVIPSPKEGYKVESVTADGVALEDIGNAYSFNIKKDTEVKVNFVPVDESTQHSFKIDLHPDSIKDHTPTITGLNSGNPSIKDDEFELGREYFVKEGTSITLTFNEHPGSVELIDEKGQVISTGPTHTIHMTKPVSYFVKYIAKNTGENPPIKVTITPTEGGNLNLGDVQTGTLDKWPWKTPLSLNVKADTGYKLSSITYDDGSGPKDASAWLNTERTQLNIPATHTQKDLTISATFVKADGSGGGDDNKNPDGDENKKPGEDGDDNKTPLVPTGTHTITAEAGDHGTITPGGKVSVPHGGDMTFVFTPNTGYQVKSITINGKKYEGARTSYTFENVEEDGSIYVEFQGTAAIGLKDPITKTIRTVTSLAQTGDIQGPAILALISIACAAFGVAILVSGRRRTQKGSHAK